MCFSSLVYPADEDLPHPHRRIARLVVVAVDLDPPDCCPDSLLGAEERDQAPATLLRRWVTLPASEALSFGWISFDSLESLTSRAY